MHLVDGLIAPPVLAATSAIAAGGVAFGLKRLEPENLPRAALASGVFFVASLVHVPLGPSSVHLLMAGLAGVVLGWAACPALAVALVLQAVFFGFGGLTTLGVNLLVMAGPAVALGLAGRAALARFGDRVAVWVGGLVGGLSVILGATMAALVLAASGEAFRPLAQALVVAHLPVAAIEAAVTAAALSFLVRLRPAGVAGHA
jgi:cobalt/nickel transport system permease protein